jgi:ATP-dependent DNA helicase RecG
MSAGAPQGREPARPLDADLPLELLDRSLSPIRRVVRYAVEQGRRPLHLSTIAARHVDRARSLDLPEALRAQLEALGAALAGLDSADDERFQADLAQIFAGLARFDAVAGLPLRRAIRPVAKRRVEPEPEPEPVSKSTAPVERSSRPSRDERSWSGRLDVQVSEVLGDARLGDLALEELLLQPPVESVVLPVVHGAGRPLPEGLVAVGGRARLRVTVCEPSGGRRERLLLVGAGGLWAEWPPGQRPHPSLVQHGERCVLIGEGAGQYALSDAEVVVPLADGAVSVARYGGDDDRERREAILRLRDQLLLARDPLQPETLRRAGLPSRGAALLGLHRGAEGHPERVAARRRLAFDEALWIALGCGVSRYAGLTERGLPHTLLHGGQGRLGQTDEIVLHDEQQAVFEDIKRDLRRGVPMRRLLTGEVGAGKGRIALMAAVTVAESKSQVLFLGPDEAEADQRFQHSEPLFRELGLVARLVDDEPTRAQRDAIKRGEVHVLFGTEALLRADLSFRRLGLVISVERFPFGASVHDLKAFTPRPDLLVLSQVPVGARILSTAYADFDVSVVKHAHRLPAVIRLAHAQRRDEAYAVLREQLAAGHQGMVLFPRVKNTDALDLHEASQVVAALERDALHGARLGLLHGAQTVEERRRVVEDLVHRRLDVLVSTMAVEDGPPILAVTAVIVEQADRMTQWRLHRVIGYLSTTPHPSTAVLVVGEMADPDAEAQIQRVVSARNGYELTESLVKLKGVDACVVPTRPPLPEPMWLDFDTDRDLVFAARDEAHRLLRADPALRRGAHQEIASELRNAWDALWPDVEGWECPIAPADGAAPVNGDRRKRRRKRKRK